LQSLFDAIGLGEYVSLLPLLGTPLLGDFAVLGAGEDLVAVLVAVNESFSGEEACFCSIAKISIEGDSLTLSSVSLR